MKKPLIIIAGATATGKTKAAVELCKKINGEVISADSMQVYKYMDIGTAKPSQEEMEGIKHHIVDVLEPSDEFSAAVFQNMAKESINKIYEKNKIPVLVGGTGFYINSVLYDNDFTETKTDTSLRERYYELAKKNGSQYIHSELAKIDPESANAIHPNNIKRVIRAIEYFYQTGKKISSHNAEQRQNKSPYNYTMFVLNMERSLLYKKIHERISKMIEKGLTIEVEKLLNMGYKKDLVSMQGLGYKEIVLYLENKLTLDEAEELLAKNTRHFAKRQITWFKAQPNAIWLDVDNICSICLEMLKYIEQNEILV